MSRSITKRRATCVGVVASLAAAGLVTTTGSALAAPSTTGVASPALGTSLGGNVVSIAGTGFRDPITGAVAVETPKVVVGATPSCTSAGTNITTWAAVSATRITATMPAGTVPTTAASVRAVICFKDKAGTAWTSVPYTYAKPVTAPTSGALLTPSSGPMSGGQTVTVLARQDTKTGTTVTEAFGVFQPGTTVFVGTVPATSVRPAGSSLSFVTPVSSAQGAQTITVRTPGFADYKIANGYKLTRAISISPTSGPTTEDTSILVKGAGFLSSTYDFDGTDSDTTSDKKLHVYLSDGQTFTKGAATTDPADEFVADPVVPTLCGNVQIISDTELSCDVPKATVAETNAGQAAKPFTVIVTDNQWTPTENSDGTVAPNTTRDPANDSVVSRGAIFIRADF